MYFPIHDHLGKYCCVGDKKNKFDKNKECKDIMNNGIYQS